MTAVALASLPSLLFAQKAGDIISGVIEDNMGPVMAVNVIEVDATGRIMAHSVTDLNGEFSFRLVNPKDRLQASYVGYETVDLPFDKTYFEIHMKEMGDLEEVVIKADAVIGGSGLDIPEREYGGSIQTINMEEFEGLGMTTVDEALQGRITGLDIVFDSGNLGSRSTMHLRGVSTMSGDGNPLIVVDGNIWEIDANLKNNFDYQNDSNNEEKVSELLNINPEDIASISVLKDAAATAIWGSRGSNGVMEIKTKRGSRGKTRVTYTYRMNGTWQPNGYKLLDGDQYTMYLKESFFNPELSDNASNIKALNYDDKWSEYEMFNNNTDWVSLVKSFGVQQSHNVSVSGGGEKANFRISAGFDDQTGSVIGQKMNRFTTRVAFDYFVSERIKVVTNFSMTYSKNKTCSTGLATAMKMMPNLAVYYEDKNGNPTGEYYQMPEGDDFSQLPHDTNPLAYADYYKNYNTSLNVSPEFQLVYNLLGLNDGEHRLTYEARVTFNVTNSGTESFNPANLVYNGPSSSSSNKASSNSNKSSSVGTTHTLTFVPAFENRNHSVRAMLRYQLNNGNSKGQSQGTHGSPHTSLQSSALNTTIDNISTSASQSRSINVTFQAHYSYKSKYSADFTLRSDGSTRFGDAKRWGTFPAASARWNVSDEDWFKDVVNESWIDMLSIRPSWGYTGNAPGGDGMFYSKYSSGSAYLGSSTIYPGNIRLSSMQWEETTSWNLGFDFGLLRGKVSSSLEFYTRTTRKMLNSNYPIPTSSGFSSLAVVNDGSMRNYGWELTINANQFVRKGDFSMNGNFSLADNYNEILDMNSLMLDQKNPDFNYNNGQYLTYVALHNSFGSIYGFKYLGVYQYSDYSEKEVPGVSGPNAPVVKDAEGNVILNSKGKTKPMMFAYGTDGNAVNYEFVGGDAIYEDINHDGNINELDIVYLGSSLPKFNGGFGLRMQYKRFSWNNQFNFRWGNRIVNQGRMNSESMYNTDNTSAAVNWRWRVEGDGADGNVLPRALYQYGYNYLGSDRFVEDGSFLRWNYTQFSYSLDRDFVKRLGLSSVSMNLNFNNVCKFTKYSGMDPEVGGGTGIATDGNQTPRSKQFTVGLSVGF